jgi:AraC-like DNA-binding protein
MTESFKRTIKFDEDVKRVFDHFLDLYENQKDAANAVGVNVCTINKYNTSSESISLPVFQRMAEKITSLRGPDDLESVAKGSVEKIIKKASMSNSKQLDDVMYRINDSLYRILTLYASPFKSREAAGRNLGMNPRTFLSYLKKQTKSFPRRYFWAVVKELNRRGFSNEEIFRLSGVQSWDEILQTLEKSGKPDSGEKDKLQEDTFGPRVETRLEQTFGNVGNAVDLAVKDIANTSEQKLQLSLGQDNLFVAVEVLNHFAKILGEYKEWLKRKRKAVKKRRKPSISSRIEPLEQIKGRMVGRIERIADGYSLSLVKRREGMAASFFLARNYVPTDSYVKGDWIYHNGLGLGEVVEVRNGTRLIVRFQSAEYGSVELAMNEKSFYI